MMFKKNTVPGGEKMKLQRLKTERTEADAVVIGAAAGLSAAAGRTDSEEGFLAQ